VSPEKDKKDEVEETTEAAAEAPTDEEAKPKRTRKAPAKAEAAESEETEAKPKRARKAPAKAEAEEEKPKRTRKTPAKAAEADGEEKDEAEEKPKRTRKTPAKAEAEEEEAPKPRRRTRAKEEEAPEERELVLVRAQAKYVRTSARKARLVSDHIRGKDVEEAKALLAFTPRSAAKAWTKLLDSAVANAEHNHELVGDELRIAAVYADEGPTLKRFRPKAMGRATRIRKRTAHLTIELTPKE
jgi:large subunit ribosomal protein L22